MVTPPNKIYADYTNKGGLLGITQELLHLSKQRWYNTPYAKELYNKAVEIYKKAFPKGKTPKNANEVLRRVGVFASVVSRTKNKRKHRILLNLYLDYTDICNRLRNIRKQCELLSNYREVFINIINILNTAKKTVSIPKKVEEYMKAIKLFTKEVGKLVLELGRISSVTKLWTDISYLYYLGTTWFRFRLTFTYETGDERFGTRYLEDVVRCVTHAELVFMDFTEEKLKEIVEYLLTITENEWLLNLREEVTGIQLISYTQGILPKKVRIDIKLYDHNYSIVRVQANGYLPNDWQKYDTYELLKIIEKTGSIEVYVVRGTRGRYRGEAVPKYIYKTEKVDGITYKKIEGIKYLGREEPITKYIKKEKITHLPDKNEINKIIREYKEKEFKKKRS